MENRPQKQEESKPKRERKVAKSLVDVLNGNLLTREAVMQHLPFLMFLSVLALVYIANGYYFEDTVRQLHRNNKELHDFRSEVITIKAKLMRESNQTALVKKIEDKGLELEESLTRPKKIIVEPGELEP